MGLEAEPGKRGGETRVRGEGERRENLSLLEAERGRMVQTKSTEKAAVQVW